MYPGSLLPLERHLYYLLYYLQDQNLRCYHLLQELCSLPVFLLLPVSHCPAYRLLQPVLRLPPVSPLSGVSGPICSGHLYSDHPYHQKNLYLLYSDLQQHCCLPKYLSGLRSRWNYLLLLFLCQTYLSCPHHCRKYSFLFHRIPHIHKNPCPHRSHTPLKCCQDC